MTEYPSSAFRGLVSSLSMLGTTVEDAHKATLAFIRCEWGQYRARKRTPKYLAKGGVRK